MIYDVSMPLLNGMPVYRNTPSFRRVETRSMAQGDRWNASRVEMSCHCGTHIDTPLHFIDSGSTVDQVPPEVLMGPARLVHFPDADRIDVAELERMD